MKSAKNHNKPSERGQALVIIAFAIIGLVALTALTIDGGNVYSDRRHAQNAADTSVLATALSMVHGDPWSTAQVAGLNRAASNGYIDGDASANSTSTRTNVEIYNPPIIGEYVGDSEYVQVIITSNVDTYFAPIVGVHQLTNKVQAVARVEPVDIQPFLEGNAIVSCNQHACPGVTIGGSSATTLIGGGLFVNSDCEDNPSQVGFVVNGGGGLNSPSLCTVGGYQDENLNVGYIDTNCEPVDCSTDFVEPNIQCAGNAEIDAGDSTILHPGYFNDNKFPPDGVETLMSGTYCVTNGDFDFPNGTLNGIEVLIYVMSGEVRINGGTVHLTAPSFGTYEGLLIALPRSNDSPITINGNADMSYQGTILAPSSHITIDGTSAQEGFLDCQVIGDIVDITGGSDTIINYSSDDNWEPTIPPQIEFIE